MRSIPWPSRGHTRVRLIVPSVLVHVSLFALLFAAPPGLAADPVKKLVRILSQASDYKQRLAAVIGLARQNDPRAIPAIIAALHDAHYTVRGTAANVLGRFGGPQVEAALEELLPREKNDFVIAQAQTTLAALIRRGQQQGASPDGLEVAGTRGTLDREEVQEGVNARLPQARACFNRLFLKAGYMGGRVTLLVRIAVDGKVKSVRMGHSDLGSFEAERCIVGVMRTATFDKPDGGEAEFTVPLSFGGGAPVPTLDPVRSVAARRLQRNCKKILAPDQLVPPNLQITLYVDAGGRVLSAGFSASGTEIPPQLAEEMATRLKQLSLGTRPGGGGTAKLVVPFSCGAR